MKKSILILIALIILISSVQIFSISAYAEYSSISSLVSFINNSGKPGDVYEIADGTYSDISLSIAKSGTAGNPITIKAKNPGKVIIKGESYISITGSYVLIEGIRFEEITRTSYPFTVTGKHCTINNCAFYNFYVPNDSSSKSQWWVRLKGAYNTVSNCFFSKKDALAVGQMVMSDTPDHHTVKNCYFGDISQKSTNGYEAIRFGASQTQDFDSYSVIEGCFFYMCNGESEAVSVKASNVTVRNNTFYNTNGCITLRHGDDNEVCGNLFIGPGTDSSYGRILGVIVYGDNQRVHNNYFYNFNKNNYAIFLGNGNAEKADKDAGYDRTTNAAIYNNTMIGGDRFLRLGAYQSNTTSVTGNKIKAPEGKVYNNFVAITYGTGDIIFNDNFKQNDALDDPVNAVPYHNVVFSDNYIYDKKNIYTKDAYVLEGYEGSPDPTEGIIPGRFKLIYDGCFFNSGLSGIGASSEEIKKAPLRPEDVLADWIIREYYGSAKTTFFPIANDPVNDVNAHINNLIDFDISFSVKSGSGKLSAYANNKEITGKTYVAKKNPVIKFTAEPELAGCVPLWYVNGVLTDSGKEYFLLSDITENYNVEVVFRRELNIKACGNNFTVFDEEADGEIFAAAYSDTNKLISYTKYIQGRDIEFTQDDIAYIKVFKWNNFADLNPLRESFCLNIEKI